MRQPNTKLERGVRMENQSMMEEYNTADLSDEMLHEIKALENEFRNESDEQIILIAYTHK